MAVKTSIPGSRHKRRLKAKLRARDGDDCHLCRGLLVFGGNPLSDHYATIDHLTPRAEGGGNDIDNLKLAHRRCNLRRGTGPVTRMGWE